MKSFTFWSLIFHIFCLIGVVYQIVDISKLYFAYTTLTSLSTRTERVEPISLPTLALCFRYVDVLNWKTVRELTGQATEGGFVHPQWKGRKIEWSRTIDPIKVLKASSYFTIKEIFELTPPEHKLIAGFAIRNISNPLVMVSGKKKNASNYFAIDKFVYQDFICYRIRVRDETMAPPIPRHFHRHTWKGGLHSDVEVIEGSRYRKINARSISESLHSPRLFMKVNLGHAFYKANIFFPVVYYGTYPYMSAFYSPRLSHLSDHESITPQHSIYIVTQQEFFFHFLPPPHNDGCNPRVEIRSSCLFRCSNEILKAINRTSFSHVRNDSTLNLKPVSYKDIKDPKMAKVVNDSMVKCEEKCQTFSCHFSLSRTSVSHSILKRLTREFSIEVITPSEPTVDIISTKKMTLIEFLSYVSSCLGIWFGLNISGFNPISWYERRRRKKWKARSRSWRQ